MTDTNILNADTKAMFARNDFPLMPASQIADAVLHDRHDRRAPANAGSASRAGTPSRTASTTFRDPAPPVRSGGGRRRSAEAGHFRRRYRCEPVRPPGIVAPMPSPDAPTPDAHPLETQAQDAPPMVPEVVDGPMPGADGGPPAATIPTSRCCGPPS